MSYSLYTIAYIVRSYVPTPIPLVLRTQAQHLRPSRFHHIPQTSLFIPSHHILLHPTHRPPQPRPNNTKQRSKQLRRVHKHTQNPKRARELDKFVDLVEVVLRLDQVGGRGGVFLGQEVQDRDEGDGEGEEGEEPDAEELVDGDVEG